MNNINSYSNSSFKGERLIEEDHPDSPIKLNIIQYEQSHKNLGSPLKKANTSSFKNGNRTSKQILHINHIESKGRENYNDVSPF